MKRILGYVKKYWYTALLAPLLMVVEVLMDMLLPMQMQRDETGSDLHCR